MCESEKEREEVEEPWCFLQLRKREKNQKTEKNWRV